MDISMRDLFSRENIRGEVISLRNSLANHIVGVQMGLRKADQFRFPLQVDGFNRGCHRATGPAIGKLAIITPAWVSVDNNETRTVEGVLKRSHIAPTDVPLKPWHTFYDWNLHVLVDKQYTYITKDSNKHSFGSNLECEWETGDPKGNGFFPKWAWPQDDDRVWIRGRWIFDCGHPEEGHRTEIHPPKAVVSFRAEAVKFKENTGPTRATRAVVYIGRNGGYWRHPINDEDYAFDLYLPPRPSDDAKPLAQVMGMTHRTEDLPVQPRIVPVPVDRPKLFRIVIPLKGVMPHPQQYGAIVSAGWTDPRGTETAKIRRVRVVVNRLIKHANLDFISADEWHLYVGVNGRWNIDHRASGNPADLGFSVDVDLHPDDKVHITASGFEADKVHGHMGEDSDLSWDHISDRGLTREERDKIHDRIAFLLADTLDFSKKNGVEKDENEKLGYFSQFHKPSELDHHKRASDKGDYELEYTISSRE